MTISYEILSADCHLDPEFLPRDAFAQFVSQKHKDIAPRVVTMPDGPTWFCGDTMLSAANARRLVAFLANSERGKRMSAAGFDPDQSRPGSPRLRIEDQDKDGVDAELMYGPLRRWHYLQNLDGATAEVIAAAYNEFIAAFCDKDRKRLFALGAVPPTEPLAMAKELKHVAELGLSGAELPLVEAERPIFDPYWDPVWSAAVEYNLPMHLHVPGAVRGMPGPDAPLVSRATFICGIPFQLHPTVCNVLLSGILERHDKLKIVLAESGTGWIPYLLDRIDYEWENSYSDWKAICTTRPSELFRRQMYATFQEDAIGPQLAHLYPKNFLWGSDYPHPDGIWPDSQEVIQKTMGGLDDTLRKRIVRDNAVELYGMGRS